ncbi:MAG: ATP-dependent zinc metalloprotease FtsH [Anaerolinea sp.]|nr:ATP-dependent zinc metalloprotease FtsH [Anaerolinea sp.]
MFLPPNRDKQPDGKPDDKKPTPPRFPSPNWIWLVFLGLLLFWAVVQAPNMLNAGTSQPIELPYSAFYDQVTGGNVAEVVIEETQVRGRFNSVVTFPEDGSPLIEQGLTQRTSTTFTSTLPPVGDSDLVSTLLANNVVIVGQITQANPILLLLWNFFPILILIGFFVWQARRTQRQMGGVFGFGQTKARQYDAEKPQITFADVAGQAAAKSELVEIVDFLKEPDKYIALGARIPRGVLLIGPPGTGKTLLARAVAGEAGVAFFSIAASEFVEMFVGVGASRVRDLFNKAKAAAPSIVFIDEIDAVGRQRGAGLGGGNDEREQTLNQMLAEMDGFDRNESVIVMAATNRPDVLDPALLRPGRFDRQVTVALPDRKGREDILKVHARGKPLDQTVDTEAISKATIGFSGADIANLANEAALTAARKNRRRITQDDFLEAFDRIVLGTASPPLANEQERRVVAYHEAGHALVATITPGTDPIFKVTIVPRGQALGVAYQMPEDDRRNHSRGYIKARMMVALGGRAAEEIVFDDVTTGAASDLKQVTQMARRMVAQFGMSDRIGQVNYGEDERQPFLGYSLSQGRSYSEETAAKIDEEVHRLIEELYTQTKALLEEHRDELEALAHELMTNEVVTRARLLEITGKEAIPAPVEPPVTASNAE